MNFEFLFSLTRVVWIHQVNLEKKIHETYDVDGNVEIIDVSRQ